MNRMRIAELKENLNKEVKRLDKSMKSLAKDKQVSELLPLLESLSVYQAELEMQNLALEESALENDVLRKHYSALFVSSPLPAFVVDNRLVILESNEAAKQLIKECGNSVFSQNALTRIFSASTVQGLFQYLNECLSSHHEVAFDIIENSQGEIRYFKGHFKEIEYQARGHLKCLFLLQEVTNDVKLSKQEQLFLDLLEHSNQMLMVIDSKGSLKSHSTNLDKLIVSSGKFDRVEQLPEEVQAVIQTYIETELTRGERIDRLVEINHADIGHYFFNISLFPISNDSAELNVGVILRDDTRRVEQENELSLVLRVFNEGTQGVTIADAKGNIVQVNEACEEITGYQAFELIGMPLNFITRGMGESSDNTSIWDRVRLNGSWSGEVWNTRKNGEKYAQWLSISCYPKQDKEPSHFITLFQDVTDRKHKEKEIHALAYFDALTQCGNRRKFKEQLNALIEQGAEQTFYMFYFDVDLFKIVNDIHGHELGDELLKTVVDRTCHLIKSRDEIYRLGGDEFIIVFRDLPDAKVAGKAASLLETCSKPYYINGNKIHSTISIGIVKFPDDGNNVSSLLKHADTAMYAAKERSRGTYEFFNPQMLEILTFREKVERHLRLALTKNEMYCTYMPVVCNKTGRIRSVELLLRWSNEELGRLAPDVFIPIAERCGIIHKLTEFVIQDAVKLINELDAQAIPLDSVAVNISGADFSERNQLLECISQISESVRCRLKLEITERVLVKDSDKNFNTIKGLKGLGLMLSIDDFGTGFSSLQYLANFNVDEIKIDKSFLDKLFLESNNSQNLCSAIIYLSKALNCNIVAEGVETKEQSEWLAENNCNSTQGYYFYKPLAKPDFIKAVAKCNAS